MAEPIELRISDGSMAFGDVPEHIDERLKEAVKSRPDPKRCEELLWEAHRLGPKVLPVYYALYKFYFNRKKLDEAKRVALIGIDAAARELGLSSDWSTFTPSSTDWRAAGAARFTLFTMKALAFISLRLGSLETATAILDKLTQIDPGDQVGYGTIAAMARRVVGGED